jgi:CBS domain-containing protein
MHEDERVDRVMSESVVSIDVAQPAGAVLSLFARHPIHHLPVVSGGKLVGMLSSADVMKLKAFIPKSAAAPDEFLNQRVSISALMQKPVVSIQPQRPLLEAANLMASHGIHALPVVDEQDRLLGIITTTDIIHAVLNPPPRLAMARPPPDARPEPLNIELSAAQLDESLAAANAAIYADNDPQGIATALVGLQRRMAPLERVLQCADRYMNCGQDPPLYTAMRKAIEAAKGVIPSERVDTPELLGLPGD